VIAKPFDPMRLADQVLEMWERLAHPGLAHPGLAHPGAG